MIAVVQTANAEGARSRVIYADDPVEVLLSIADHLYPQVWDTTNDVVFPCHECGEAHSKRLVWQGFCLLQRMWDDLLTRQLIFESGSALVTPHNQPSLRFRS